MPLGKIRFLLGTVGRGIFDFFFSSLSEVKTDSESDEVDRVVGSSPSSSSNESSPETDFIQEPRAETLPLSKYG